MKFVLLFLVMIGGIACVDAQVQDPASAKSAFEKAQQSFKNKQYGNTLTLLEQSKQFSGGNNLEIIYLEIKARYFNDLNIMRTKGLIDLFLKNSFISDPRRTELSNLLTEIESSNNYHPNGVRRTSQFVNESGYNCIVHYTTDGWVEKTLCYENGKVNRLTQGIYFKAANDRAREELYFVDEAKNQITFFEDNTKVIEIVGGTNVFIFNKDGEMVQAYSKDEQEPDKEVDFVHMGLFQEDTYDPESDFSAWHDIEIIEIYPINTLVPPAIQENFKLGMVKKAKRNIWQDKGEWEIYTFDENGVPVKKEYYKRQKLKDTYSFNPRSKQWTEK